MKYQYNIKGLTCQSCANTVKVKLEQLLPNHNAYINLKKSKVIIEGKMEPDLKIMNNALPQKYTLSNSVLENEIIDPKKKSTLKELKPLFLILSYILIASILIHYKYWNTSEFMTDFMGLFFIVFSFFKILDVNGFVKAFKMYDPIAQKSSLYAKIYPFIEVVLGLLFLFRFKITLAILLTIIILTITTIGVVKTLLNKKEIQCACLGSVLKLKMTEATLIENTIMIVMGLSLLVQLK